MVSINEEFAALKVNETIVKCEIVRNPLPKAIAECRQKMRSRYGRAIDRARLAGMDIDVATPAVVDSNNRVVVVLIATRIA